MNNPNTPFFLTIDTEGDNMWDKPQHISSKNTENLYRFQELCNKYYIRPIYLTNYEASINKKYQYFIEKHKENLEIGLHLHAWNSPPLESLTKNDHLYHPYLHEYSDVIIKKKMDYMIKLLQDTFQMKIFSHRGGRYSISERIFESLLEHDIKIDCSVLPGFDMKYSLGNPHLNGGPDFTHSPLDEYMIYKEILELPISVYQIPKKLNNLKISNPIRKVLSKFGGIYNTPLRSKCNNLKELKKIVNWNLKRGATHLEYIIHSSELVKGTSPLINNKQEEELFYKNLEDFFIFLQSKKIKSMTFKEYYQKKYINA